MYGNFEAKIPQNSHSEKQIKYIEPYACLLYTSTGMSDRKSRQIIRRAKKTNPNAIIAVTGCYAQTSPGDVEKIEGVNIIVGTKDRKNIVAQMCIRDRSLSVFFCIIKTF